MHRALVLENNPLVSEDLREMLLHHAPTCMVSVAEDVCQATAAIAASIPDLAILHLSKAEDMARDLLHRLAEGQSNIILIDCNPAPDWLRDSASKLHHLSQPFAAADVFSILSTINQPPRA